MSISFKTDKQARICYDIAFLSEMIADFRFLARNLYWVWVLISPIGCSWKNDNINTESISSNGKVTLSLDEVHGATSYNVYLSVQPNLILQNKLMAYSIGMRRA